MSYISVVIYITTGILTVLVTSGVVYRKLAGKCKSKNRIEGKTVVITGGSAGIGKATAEELARRGGKIILACRNLEKAQKVANTIIDVTGNPEVIVMKLDLSDLRSVEDFARNFKQNEKQLDILINNAGSVSRLKKKSSQGFELIYATNHLGHFLLTNLLLDVIKKSDGARIVNVASGIHHYYSLDLDDLNCEKRHYNALASYGRSKICNILFSNELSRRLQDTGVTCNCLHPGTVYTDISNKENTVFEILVSVILKLVAKTSAQGAETTIYLAVADEVKNVTGKYFANCKERKPAKHSESMQDASRLWEISEKQTGYEFS